MIEAVDQFADAYDVAVVGAGPAGLAAATQCVELGLSVVVLDENVSAGGQIYRAVTSMPEARVRILGDDFRRGRTLADAFAACGATYAPKCSVWMLRALEQRSGYALFVSLDGRSRQIEAGAVILATGAQERPCPIPGWTLPGVMTAGAAQIALKSGALVPDGRVVLAGSGPLLYLLAWQYANAGVAISAFLDTTPDGNRWRAAAHVPGFLRSPYPAKGLRLLRAVRSAVPVTTGVKGLRAEGTGRLTRVAYVDRAGVERRVDADLLLLHQGVVPGINLAAASGCGLQWDERQACFRPVTDEWGESDRPGIFIAGDGAAISGAEAAPLFGRLSALQAATRLGVLEGKKRDVLAAHTRASLKAVLRGRPFLDALYRPAGRVRELPDDVIACRCEEVTVGQVKAAVATGARGPGQLKAYLRCGMGPCQARMCGLTITELIAAATGKSPQDVGYFRPRPPVKPVTLGELAGLPKSVAERSLVERS